MTKCSETSITPDFIISQILNFSTAIQTDGIEVSCTKLSGEVFNTCVFDKQSMLSDLESRLLPMMSSDHDVLMIAAKFLCREGTELPKTSMTKDHPELCMSIIGVVLPAFTSAFNACSSCKHVGKLFTAANIPADVAGNVLYRCGSALSVQLLGECLGNYEAFWAAVALGSYPQNFLNFAGMDIVQAIRTYLWSFRLPGESAQIERILEGFSRSYFQHNTDRPHHSAQSSQDTEEGDVAACHSCFEATAVGWYVHQPRSGPDQLPCCVHCGQMDNLHLCQGCNIIHFCRRCKLMASRRGHAVVGALGYGRACVAARKAASIIEEQDQETLSTSRSSDRPLGDAGCDNEETCPRWEPASPFMTEDSVLVLSYAIIMLATNIHSVNVKSKMQKHQFLKQVAGANGASGKCNFPGDFLSQIYDEVSKEELKVRRD